MFRILIVETGEYLYSVNDGTGLLHTIYELDKYDVTWYKVYEAVSREEAYAKLQQDNYCVYHLSQNLFVNSMKNPELFEIMEINEVLHDKTI